MIQSIPIQRILPHPDNPRKNLGDLTELADSIRQNGVLQNLTVVKQEERTGLYTCVIGHRRLAAAKLAGLSEVPCTVAEMTMNRQRITMLTENMQRADLTLIEQADAFQTMLNLGDSVASLADKTGLSESTVRRRVKLAALDREKFEQAEARGGTLKDYLALEQISDPELKNKVLSSIGTNNFEYELKNALRDEKLKQKQDAWRPVLAAFAGEITQPDWEKHRTFKNIQYDADPAEFEAPADAEPGEYFFNMENGWFGTFDITLYVSRDSEKGKNAADEHFAEINRHQEERQARVKQLNELSLQAAQLRAEFVRDYPIQSLRENAFLRRLVTAQLLENLLLSDDWLSADVKLFTSALDLTIDDEEGPEENLIQPALDQPLERVLLALTLATGPDEDGGHYFNRYDGRYHENEEMDRDYNFLCQLGYRMSDAEKQLQDGTHPLYLKKEEKA